MKKEPNPTRPVRRINLTLPIVRSHSHEIYATKSFGQHFPSSNACPSPARKVPSDSSRYLCPQRTRVRSPSHLMSSRQARTHIDAPLSPPKSSRSMAETISHALINSGYSAEILRAASPFQKRRFEQADARQQHVSISERLWFDSVESFDDRQANSIKRESWSDVHPPTIIGVKSLHQRKPFKPISAYNEVYLRVPQTSSLDNLTDRIRVPFDECRQRRIEQITNSYFPSIGQLRQGHRCPELISNRMYLHRERRRDFIP